MESDLLIDYSCVKVVSYSSNARIAMVESTEWNVVETLFGLLTCPIPHALKAQIFNTIAAFAVDADNANKVRRRSRLCLTAAQFLLSLSFRCGSSLIAIRFSTRQDKLELKVPCSSTTRLGLKR